MITYVCQNFGVDDVHGQIPKRIYQASYLLPSDFPRLLIWQKLILKFCSKKCPFLNPKNIFQKIYCLKRV